jgi:SAM-dependent methyltransferase
MARQHHQSDPRILNRRTLAQDHKHLAGLLRPGMKVLDVGCGTGAITADIAALVGPAGEVLGIDRDSSLIALAQRSHSSIPHLTFEVMDVLSLASGRRFDLVTTARTLQWISEPGDAVRKMVQCLMPGGVIALLDYDHEAASWTPSAPPEFMTFYSAFLEWRASNHWMNDVAEHLGDMLGEAGVTNVQVLSADHRICRGDDAFEERASIWASVIETLGSVIQSAGFLPELDLQKARDTYLRFVESELDAHTMKMNEAIGTYSK